MGPNQCHGNPLHQNNEKILFSNNTHYVMESVSISSLKEESFKRLNCCEPP